MNELALILALTLFLIIAGPAIMQGLGAYLGDRITQTIVNQTSP